MIQIQAFKVALVVKNLTANAEDLRDACSIPWLGRYPGRGHGNPFQYSYLVNPMDRGAWQTTQSIRLHRVRHDEVTYHAQICHPCLQ